MCPNQSSKFALPSQG
ncbi:hypothetical protein D049_2019A, partial [Vibrio parahaemolyticus VPTS-2010]